MTTAVRPVTTPADWEAAKAVRFEVFVDEQQVPAEIEIDEHDATARHWLLVVDAAVAGTARVVVKPDGFWKIGRVAVRAPYRGKGLGATVMTTILNEAEAAGAPGAVLESQVQAMGFYEKLAFVPEGSEFFDAGIPHVLMRRRFGAG